MKYAVELIALADLLESRGSPLLANLATVAASCGDHDETGLPRPNMRVSAAERKSIEPSCRYRVAWHSSDLELELKLEA